MSTPSTIEPFSDALIDAFLATQAFALDPFQLEAMRALRNGQSVLVSAPTGSGKTIVAEFAIFAARHEGKRCIYTTPLKALSNQKFRDLHAIMPDDVGLVTGDVVINPDAAILVMTTEILRNILHADPERVSDVAFVILDEAHYIGADGRGTVWEETIVFLGKHSQIVALSATIPNADELASWVSSVHRPMSVITHAKRPVPLLPFVYVSDLEPLYDKRGKVRIKDFKSQGWIDTPLTSQVVKALAKQKMLPAIFFVFSRVGCEREAMDVLRSGIPLTTPDEQRSIREAVDRAIEQTPGLLNSNLTRDWLNRLPQGVAPHHAGLLPPLKLLIEILFQRNLIKVVFATETLAAGINMPARTVVITNLSKRTDEGHRLLTVGEFQQMTGRAGRRGMDEVGYGVVLASHRYEVADVVAMFRGQAEPLRSRFTLNFNMVANLVHHYERDQAKRIVEQCFSQFQNNATIQDLTHLRDTVARRADTHDDACPRFPETERRTPLLEKHKRLREQKEQAADALHSLEKNHRGTNSKELMRMVLAAPFRSWLVVRRHQDDAPQLALLLEKHPTKRDVQFSVLLAGGQVTLLRSDDLVVSLGLTVTAVPSEVIQAAQGLSYHQLRQVKLASGQWQAWLEESGLVDFACPVPAEPTGLTAARERYRVAVDHFEASLCFNCRHYRSRCVPEVKETQKWQREVAAYQAQIDAIRGLFWRQFELLEGILRDGDFLRGRELLPRGVALANLRTSNELLAAEVLTSGILESLTPDALAAAASAIVAEPIRGRMNWRPLRPSPEVVDATDTMIDLAHGLSRLLNRKGAQDMPLWVITEYAGMVQAWATNAQWSHVTEMTGIDEGQLVRHLRQVIDMLQQMRDVPGLAEGFRDRLHDAVQRLDRDIVKEVF